MPAPVYHQLGQEKPRPCLEGAEDEIVAPRNEFIEPRSSFIKKRSTLRSSIVALLWTIIIILSATLCLFGGAFIGRELADLVKPPGGLTGVETVTEYVTVTQDYRLGNWKWWNKRSESGEDRYSTSTLRDGSTQTFVFTTRPIVNPGGYTIGTLTGYVPVSSTTQDAEPTTTAEPAPTSVSHSKAASSAATRSASTIPSSSTHRQTSSLPSRTSLPSSSDSWSRVSTTSPPVPTSTPSSSFSGEFDFSEVDYHLLHRRGLDFESPESSSFGVDSAPSSTITSLPATVTSSAGGIEELSTSTDRHGSLYTLVKTTRPIVNPGGYVIGTLDGGWVDVAKSKPTPTAASKRSAREELKKRETISLQ